MRYFLLIILYMILPTSGIAAILNVPQDFTSIRDAIQTAKDGDLILVAPGTYFENIDFLGKRITLRSIAGPADTVLNGKRMGSVVTFRSGEGVDSILEGFTITNGTGNLLEGYWTGGGIFIEFSSPSLRGNHVHHNAAEFAGGIFIGGSSSIPELKHNLIHNNTADYDAGGIWCLESAPMILKNEIYRNKGLSGGARGGGIWCRYAGATISGNKIFKNKAETGGGIHFWFGDDSILENNEIMMNSAKYGGGVYCAASASTLILNNLVFQNTAIFGAGVFTGGVASPPPRIHGNTIAFNLAEERGGGIFSVNGASPEVKHTILWMNDAPLGPEIYVGLDLFPASLSIQYSDVRGGQASIHVGPLSILDWGPGMIMDDPLFSDPDNGVYLLKQHPCQQGVLNPCVDAGDPGAVLPEGSTRTDGGDDHGLADLGYHRSGTQQPVLPADAGPQSGSLGSR